MPNNEPTAVESLAGCLVVLLTIAFAVLGGWAFYRALMDDQGQALYWWLIGH